MTLTVAGLFAELTHTDGDTSVDSGVPGERHGDDLVVKLNGATRRLSRPDFGTWLATVARTAKGCTHPVRSPAASMRSTRKPGRSSSPSTPPPCPTACSTSPAAQGVPACVHPARTPTGTTRTT